MDRALRHPSLRTPRTQQSEKGAQLTSNRKSRVALAGALATGLLVAFAAFGGVGVAQSAISAVQYQYGKQKVTLCHKGKTITVGKPAAAAHVRHGDFVGTCAQAAKAKKAKAAKAQAKAAKKAEHAKAKAAKAKANAEKAKAKAERPESASEESGKGKGRGKGK